MSNVQVALHFVNLALFIIVFINFIKLTIEIYKIPNNRIIGRRYADIVTNVKTFKFLSYSLTLSGAFLSLTFIVLQKDWIINQHNLSVGDMTSMLWLLFDYLLGIYLFISTVIGRVLVDYNGGSPYTEIKKSKELTSH